jgi:hypothetical protein
MKNRIFISIIISCGLLTAVSCKKKKEDEPVPVAPAAPASTALSINSDYQAKYTLNGTNVSDVNGGSDFNMYNVVEASTNPIGYGPSTFAYGSFIGKMTNDVGIDVLKGTITLPNGGSPPSDSEFMALFPTGAAAYSAGAANGVIVSYWDGSVYWRSDLGTADQSGSTFNIVDRKAVTASDYSVKVYATFNCKVYDGNGNSKTITNGTFIGVFAKI